MIQQARRASSCTLKCCKTLAVLITRAAKRRNTLCQRAPKPHMLWRASALQVATGLHTILHMQPAR